MVLSDFKCFTTQIYEEDNDRTNFKDLDILDIKK
jgi:hypothetical protein